MPASDNVPNVMLNVLELNLQEFTEDYKGLHTPYPYRVSRIEGLRLVYMATINFPFKTFQNG